MTEDDQIMSAVRFNVGKRFGDWTIEKRLDEGGFGQVYLVVNSSGKKGALKAESNEIEGGSAIKLETLILKKVTNGDDYVPHIPSVYHSAKRKKYCYMVMTLLGDNLKHLKSGQKNERFTRGTWSRVGIQCLYALKFIHDAGFIHRDIKPQNFTMGHVDDSERWRLVHILDFGLARPFATLKDGKWKIRKARGTAEFRGTLRYTSPNVHRKKEQGRVDDVWSLIYVLIELNGGLPWQNVKDRETVDSMKLSMKNEQVMQNMPKAMIKIQPHLETLDYYQRPDYHFVFSALWQVMANEKVQTNSRYDWETEEQAAAGLKMPKAEWENPEGRYFSADPLGINGANFGNNSNKKNEDCLKSEKSNIKPPVKIP